MHGSFGLVAGRHADFMEQAIAFLRVTALAGRHDIVPGVLPSLRPRNDVIQRQTLAAAAV